MTMLYQKCPACRGTTCSGEVSPAGYVSHCRTCCETPTPGYVPVGLTLADVEAVRADRDALLVALDDMKDYEMGYCALAVIDGRDDEIEEIRRRRAKGDT